MTREVIDEMAIVHGDRFTLDSDGPSEGSWDRDAIRRAVENLIGNAIKY
jgi:signal transduction histidine kinase